MSSIGALFCTEPAYTIQHKDIHKVIIRINKIFILHKIGFLFIKNCIYTSLYKNTQVHTLIQKLSSTKAMQQI